AVVVGLDAAFEHLPVDVGTDHDVIFVVAEVLRQRDGLGHLVALAWRKVEAARYRAKIRRPADGGVAVNVNPVAPRRRSRLGAGIANPIGYLDSLAGDSAFRQDRKSVV